MYVPGGDYDAYVESHVRRLEALRRAGIVERIDPDRWLIPAEFKAPSGIGNASRIPRLEQTLRRHHSPTDRSVHHRHAW